MSCVDRIAPQSGRFYLFFMRLLETFVPVLFWRDTIKEIS